MKLLVYLLLTVSLTACASPKYQTRYEFIPPATKQGAACLQRCTVKNNQCKNRFNSVGQQCLLKSRKQASVEMPGRIKAYEKALDIWEAKIRRYQRDIALYELERRHYRMMRGLSHSGCRNGRAKDKADCRRNYLRWRGAFWLDKPVYPGKAPRRPTLKKVTAEIAKEGCSQENQCAVSYRQCYTACSGTVKPYQFRLAN